MARPRFNGAAATLAALVGGGIGLSVALFLRALVLNTPADVRPSTFYWWFVLFSAAGALWGLATQTMKQLERIQGYRHGSLRPSAADRRLGQDDPEPRDPSAGAEELPARGSGDPGFR
ncbi:hypothetical protein [Cyanobium sp. CH-040]|uniref:hypothetical protein n=1 Tax=Cyanobium sp. CH-040 TaxID=2823708 RepID=UPI0020CFC27C|nr:hypothetical protein [Cyanobium sp. CH-040]MCP9927253.1 hypothetical protein [Cyanobium sp. CH-040]